MQRWSLRRWDGVQRPRRLTSEAEAASTPPIDSKFSVFSEARRLHDRNDVIVVADLDPHTARDTWIHLDMPAPGVNWHERCTAHDPITGEHWDWSQLDFVRLGREAGPVHVIHVERERHETSPC